MYMFRHSGGPAGERSRGCARLVFADGVAAALHADTTTNAKPGADCGTNCFSNNQSTATQSAHRRAMVPGQHRHHARGCDLQRWHVELGDRKWRMQPAWRRAVLDWEIKGARIVSSSAIWSYCYVVLTVHLDDKGSERSREIHITDCIGGVTNNPNSPLPTVLRGLGERGWEMVGVASFARNVTEETHYYFKRSERITDHRYDDENPPPIMPRPVIGRR
jgi:hypothetical protein